MSPRDHVYRHQTQKFFTKPTQNALPYRQTYLRDTIDFGIHYWRPEENNNNESYPFPEILNDNHDMAAISQSSYFEPYAYVDFN